MLNFKTLKAGIEARRDELKACGANKPGGGGFVSGNSCARGGKSGASFKPFLSDLKERGFQKTVDVPASRSNQGGVRYANFEKGNVTVGLYGDGNHIIRVFGKGPGSTILHQFKTKDEMTSLLDKVGG